MQSLPIACRIEIPELKISYDKKEDEWKAVKVRVGTYQATFQALGKTVKCTFSIKDGAATRLFVNILEGTVQDKDRELAIKLEEERKRADEENSRARQASLNAPPAAAPVVPPAPVFKLTPFTATKGNPFVNTLGMRFVPAVNYDNGVKVLFCIHETRVPAATDCTRAGHGCGGS